MKKSTPLPSGGLIHTYQRTLDKGVFLYRVQDRLMLYTIMSVISRKHDVSVAAVSFMFNHIHSLQDAVSRLDSHRYLGEAMSTFVKELNCDCGRSGPMFSPVDSAFKQSGKKARSAIAYLYNNSCEKKLYRRAVEDRWDFLAYYGNDHPFSEKLRKKESSRSMRKALLTVDIFHRKGRYLNLAALRRLFTGLDRKESEQLIDYIIVKYAFIDYSLTIRYYRDFDSMVTAIDSNTGSEYDIKEEYDKSSDMPYVSMCRIAKRLGLLEQDMKLYSLGPMEKQTLAQDLAGCSGASGHQVAKFLHIFTEEGRWR